jgi:NAD(P)-dependent dehydrogenase (short-subunit alcohol dehydrogenase family)
MDLELDGRVVTVTGGASGIGRACTLAFAREGARVAVLDRDESALAGISTELDALGADFRTWLVDVSDAPAVEETFDDVVAQFGRLDVGFNNAGTITPARIIHETAEEDWDRVIDVNLKGIWLCMRAQVRHMLPRGGVIVNTASAAGLVGSPGTSAYVASKFGVIGLTKAVASEVADRGIRVNAVAPGTIETLLNNTLFDQPDPFADAIVRGLPPIGRRGRPEEIADAVLWLSSPRSSFATGSTFVVDGGFTAQ